MVEVHINHTRTRAVGENTAGRLFRIFKVCDESKSAPSTQSTTNMWRRAFALEGASRDTISYLMLDLSAEIDQLGTDAKAACLPEDIYEDVLTRLKRVVDITTLENPASGPASNLSASDVVSLRWMSLFLPDVSSSDLNESARSRVLKALEELRSAAAAPGVSPSYSEYAHHLVARMEKALNEASVKGSSALGQAALESISQTLTVAPNNGTPETVEANKKVTSKALDALKTAGEVSSNGERIINFLDKLTVKGGQLANSVIDLLSSS